MKYLLILVFLASCVEPVPVETEVDTFGEASSSAGGSDNNSNNNSNGNNEEENPPLAVDDESGGSGGDDDNRQEQEGTMDPLYSTQWHLENGTNAGEDLNVKAVYEAGNKGEGVTVAVVDDGLQVNHPDLVSNVNLTLSYNYTNDTNNPTPSLDYGHGTACAGIIGARDLNDIGIRGIAPRTALVGYNLLSNFTSANANDAMTRNKNVVGVSNNSWGPPDGRGDFYSPDPLWLAGLEEGLATGRDGKGIVYVFAAGNGALAGDLSTYDGFASQPGVMAVASIGDNGQFAAYSEVGANLWISAPSMGDSMVGITTTDLAGTNLGYNKGNNGEADAEGNYTNSFNGTSASAPMVAGVAALILKERPELSYRDVKSIIAKSARKNHPGNAQWIANGAGIEFNTNYGFGAIDASAAVAMASDWTLLPTQVVENWPADQALAVNQAISDDGVSVTSDITIANSGINNIEFVQVELNLDHDDWGNLDIRLIRQGVDNSQSILAFPHSCRNGAGTAIDCTKADNTYIFGVSKYLDEDADGTWRLQIVDSEAEDTNTGTLLSWRLKIYGH